MYIDAYAIIVQKDMDGGDSLHREGMYAFAQKLRYDRISNTVTLPARSTPMRRPASASEMMDKFEVQPGIYVRHPDPTKWYSNPDTTSRDQVLPVIAYCAAYEDYPRLWRLFKATAKRGMFAQNLIRIGEGQTKKKIPDPMHLNIAQFIRAGGWWTAPLYPVLLVLDSVELVGTVLSAMPLHFKDDHWIPRLKNQNDVDDNNIVVQHLLAAVYKPTPMSELSRYIYSVTRPVNFGNTKLGEKNPVMGALRWYHRSEYGGTANPEMAEMYRPLIEKYFTYPEPHEYIAQLWYRLTSEEILIAWEGPQSYKRYYPKRPVM
ncbi:hypothetical protein [Bdellovibrio sp. HCB337]|uniref:hypothetical protein n=1 Tax=Bdellovibrio sp. HCB337 TaxID=3394358 RepID=UPI0039A5E266